MAAAGEPLRIAMWSGPRNISTAMMRAWGERGDTAVIDEPLYAHYLKVTGRAHPGADAVIAAGPARLDDAIRWVLGPAPGGKAIFYQKHMAHHLLPGMDRSWISKLKNCFLIRRPLDVVRSFAKHVADVTVNDTGFVQQAELFESLREQGGREPSGRVPLVIDAHDVLNDPRKMLSRLCEAVGVEFTEDMLHWPAGLRSTDGVWAKDWYQEVETTTGFRPFRADDEPVEGRFAEVVAACEPHYQRMYVHRLRG